MSKFFKRVWRRMRRAKTDAQYALLFHKVSRRLGVARARARQAEQDRDFIWDRFEETRRELIASRMEVRSMRLALLAAPTALAENTPPAPNGAAS